MKIWLDDIREMPEEYDVWAKTADQAILALQTGNVTHMSFDHDLGMEMRPTGKFGIMTAKEDKTAKSGYDVAMWVERMAFMGKLKPFTWKVHSANPVGAKNIERAMFNAERFWRKNAEETKS